MPSATDLRRAPPAAALAALRDALLPGGRVGPVRRLSGGLDHGMHALDLIAADGARRRLVLRRYPDERLRRRPDAAEREYRVLSLLGELGLPAPRPVWLDAAGALLGQPALVTTRLPGRALIAPADLADWTAQLGRTLVALHTAPLHGRDVGFLEDPGWIAEYVRRGPPAADVAAHSDGARVWSAVRHLWPGISLTTPALVHGDYWAGNTLWRRGRLVGVVDWGGCTVGDPGWDVCCCRVDLAMLIGPEAPDLFLQAYERALGRAVPHLAFWDLVGVTAALPDPARWLPGYQDLGRTDLTPELMRARLRAFVADALARAR
ncbi:MAG TPA: phosphotransferase [Chloroflexota bacterium]|jgi:aminoglycoside phosphotransferase (APT) family kinase protein